MDTSLLATMVGLSARDALNPFSIAALTYLLATPRSAARATTFVVGTYLTYFAGGVVLVRGLGYLVTEVMPRLPWWAMPAGMMTLGVVCLILAVITWHRASTGQSAFTPPKNLSVRATAMFAIVSTAADIPTGAPYIAAATQIATVTNSVVTQCGWLALYNLVFTAPLIALLTAHLGLGARARPIFARLQHGIDWAFVHLTPLVLLGLGGWLTYTPLRRYATAPWLGH